MVRGLSFMGVLKLQRSVSLAVSTKNTPSCAPHPTTSGAMKPSAVGYLGSVFPAVSSRPQGVTPLEESASCRMRPSSPPAPFTLPTPTKSVGAAQPDPARSGLVVVPPPARSTPARSALPATARSAVSIEPSLLLLLLLVNPHPPMVNAKNPTTATYRTTTPELRMAQYHEPSAPVNRCTLPPWGCRSF